MKRRKLAATSEGGGGSLIEDEAAGMASSAADDAVEMPSNVSGDNRDVVAVGCSDAALGGGNILNIDRQGRSIKLGENKSEPQPFEQWCHQALSISLANF